jgi:outer membrane receptor protein involved in Fe transport
LFTSKAGVTAAILEPFAGPGNTAPVPVLYIVGGIPNLQPETARNVTFGINWEPPLVPGLNVSLDYYDISYSGQIAAAPFASNPLNDPALSSVINRYPNSAPIQLLVSEAMNNGGPFIDLTGGAFGSNPLASTVYLYDDRFQNLSSTRTSGIDIAARYSIIVGSDRIDARLDASYIDQFATALTPSSPSISEVNTVGHPARLRLRALAAWTHRDLSISTAANYINSYPDTSATIPRDVASYTTFDLVVRYDLGLGVVASAQGANIFNQLPPYVVSGTPSFAGSHYDSANASPLGRLITLQVLKRW